MIDSKLEIIGWDELAFQYEIARGGFGTVFKVGTSLIRLPLVGVCGWYL